MSAVSCTAILVPALAAAGFTVVHDADDGALIASFALKTDCHRWLETLPGESAARYMVTTAKTVMVASEARDNWQALLAA